VTKIMGFRLDDWVYWRSFTITLQLTITYNGSPSAIASGLFRFLPELRASSLPLWLAS
jgi:hypothetical protein